LRLAQHDPAAAVRAVAAVIPEARERGLPFELGRCLLMLGTAQRKARQCKRAATTLDEAATIFRALGAQRWQALAEAQRARLAPGPEGALTPTERRIAELVASGRSNPEIAATLYISVKTIEANLTRIYRKLGVRSRVGPWPGTTSAHPAHQARLHPAEAQRARQRPKQLHLLGHPSSHFPAAVTAEPSNPHQ